MAANRARSACLAPLSLLSMSASEPAVAASAGVATDGARPPAADSSSRRPPAGNPQAEQPTSKLDSGQHAHTLGGQSGLLREGGAIKDAAALQHHVSRARHPGRPAAAAPAAAATALRTAVGRPGDSLAGAGARAARIARVASGVAGRRASSGECSRRRRRATWVQTWNCCCYSSIWPTAALPSRAKLLSRGQAPFVDSPIHLHRLCPLLLLRLLAQLGRAAALPAGCPCFLATLPIASPGCCLLLLLRSWPINCCRHLGIRPPFRSRLRAAMLLHSIHQAVGRRVSFQLCQRHGWLLWPGACSLLLPCSCRPRQQLLGCCCHSDRRRFPPSLCHLAERRAAAWGRGMA